MTTIRDSISPPDDAVHNSDDERLQVSGSPKTDRTSIELNELEQIVAELDREADVATQDRRRKMNAEKVKRWRRKKGVQPRRTAMTDDERLSRDRERKKLSRAKKKIELEELEASGDADLIPKRRTRKQAAIEREARNAPIYAAARHKRKIEKAIGALEFSKKLDAEWHRIEILDRWDRIVKLKEKFKAKNKSDEARTEWPILKYEEVLPANYEWQRLNSSRPRE